MKRPALDPSPSGPAAFSVQIERGNKGYSATVRASGRLRSIADDGASCAGLADALEITLAILLDEEAPAPPPRPVGPPPAKPAIWLFSPNELPPPDPVPQAPPRAQFVSRALVTDGLTWPGAFGFDVRVFGRFGKRWSLAASLLDVPSRGERRVSGTVDVGLLAASAGPCVRAFGRRESVGLDLCAALDLGALDRRRRGLPDQHQPDEGLGRHRSRRLAGRAALRRFALVRPRRRRPPVHPRDVSSSRTSAPRPPSSRRRSEASSAPESA